jgi:hypothetical protein
MNRNQQAALDFAQKAKAWGFRAFLAEKRKYGFVTNADGSRVVSFEFNDGRGKLLGNYGPPSSESGTGWVLDKDPDDVRSAEEMARVLAAHPPAFCGKGWSRLSTLADHLALYGTSSRYTELRDALIHYAMTLAEHEAARAGYVDLARYNPRGRDYRPEMLCHTGDAQGTRDKSAVTCPACLAVLEA